MIDTSKAVVFGASLASGVSVPVIEGATNAAGTSMGWSVVTLAVCSSVLAVVGMIMAFLDKRKIAEAATQAEIIKEQKETIGFLKEQNKEIRADYEETRRRSHMLQDDAHVKLLRAETKLATLRAYTKGCGIEIPEYQEHDSAEPIFPGEEKTKSESNESQN